MKKLCRSCGATIGIVIDRDNEDYADDIWYDPDTSERVYQCPECNNGLNYSELVEVDYESGD